MTSQATIPDDVPPEVGPATGRDASAPQQVTVVTKGSRVRRTIVLGRPAAARPPEGPQDAPAAAQDAATPARRPGVSSRWLGLG